MYRVPRSKRDSLPRGKRFPFPPLPVLICLGATAFVMSIFFRVVDLKPQVSESFFFSKSDPQLRTDNQIDKLFPEYSQLILVATGDIRSPIYAHRVLLLSDELANLPGVISVQSLSRGPRNIDEALDSDLWTRLLIAENHKSSYIFVILKQSDGEATI